MSNTSASSWLCPFALAALMVCSCTDHQPKTDLSTPLDSVFQSKIDTVPYNLGPDKTLYGRGGHFGMSTFVLVTEDGKKYDVTRVSDKGTEGEIYGSVAPGGHYALMLDESGEALQVLLNLNELEDFVGKDYYVYNGQLVLTKDGNREWVDIEALSPREFVAKGRGGTDYSFHK